jgi:hypothetical protein
MDAPSPINTPPFRSAAPGSRACRFVRPFHHAPVDPQPSPLFTGAPNLQSLVDLWFAKRRGRFRGGGETELRVFLMEA